MNRFIAGGLAWCMLSSQATGITLSPLVIELNTDHQRTSQLIITNNSTEKLALEASVRQLLFQDDKRVDISAHEDNNILVFPPAVLLEPGQNQVFRIQWISSTLLKTSASYFIRFSTADIKQDENELPNQTTSGIDININYNALLHVYSDRFHPKIEIKVEKDGSIKLSNLGNRYTFTSLLHFKGLNKNENEALANALGTRFIPPQSTMTLNSSVSLPEGTYYGLEK